MTSVDSILLRKLDTFDPYLWFRTIILHSMNRKEFISCQEVLSTLKDAKRILDSMKIDFWLEAGTCLGAVREKNFIKHDYDIDIGIFERDEDRLSKVISNFKQDGFSLQRILRDAKSGQGLEISFTRNEIKLDIFVFYTRGEYMWHGAYDARGNLLPHVFNKELFTDLKEIDFLGLRVNVPNPVEKYLGARYGDWQVERKNWNYFKDPKCIRLDFLENN